MNDILSLFSASQAALGNCSIMHTSTMNSCQVDNTWLLWGLWKFSFHYSMWFLLRLEEFSWDCRTIVFWRTDQELLLLRHCGVVWIQAKFHLCNVATSLAFHVCDPIVITPQSDGWKLKAIAVWSEKSLLWSQVMASISYQHPVQRRL